MSQSIWSTIVPTTTSGTQLATYLNDFKAAMVSGMCGTSRPSELDAGGIWVDTTNDPSWDVNIYSGTVDVTLFTINTVSGTATIAATDSSIEIVKISDDAVGPLLKLLKKRIAGGGQTLSGDSCGDIDFYALTDGSLEEKVAAINVILSDDATASAHGSYMTFSTTTDATPNLIERMRITLDGNVVIGGTTTSNKFEVVGTAAFTSAIATTATLVTANTTTENVTTANIVTANATTANIVTANATTANLTNINATSAIISGTATTGTLDATLANITTLNATNLSFGNLIVTGDTTLAHLTATTADITTLNSATNNLTNLIVSSASTLSTLVVSSSSSLANATIQSPVRVDAKKGTYAALVSYAATATNGQFLYATDTKKYYGVKDGALTELGGGAGDADTIHLIDAEDIQLTDIDLTGNNASFDGGGTITVSSLSLSTTAADLLNSTSVIKYSPAANGQNDYFGFTKSIPIGQRGMNLGFRFNYKTSSTTLDNDFRFAVKIKDGASAGTITYDNITAYNNTNNTGNIFNTSTFIPQDCTEIEFGWQNTDTTTTVQLFVNNIVISQSPFTYKDVVEMSDWTSFTVTSSHIANTTTTGKWRRVGDSMEIQFFNAYSGAPTSAALTFDIPTGYTIDTAKITTTSGYIDSNGNLLDSAASTYPIRARYSDSNTVAVYYTDRKSVV